MIETTTSLVLRALVAADDFRTCKQLCDLTGRAFNQVSAALHHLRTRKAVDCVEQTDNLWWYATPDTDTRSRVVEERTPEVVHRNRKPGQKRPGQRKRQTSK